MFRGQGGLHFQRRPILSNCEKVLSRWSELCFSEPSPQRSSLSPSTSCTTSPISLTSNSGSRNILRHPHHLFYGLWAPNAFDLSSSEGRAGMLLVPSSVALATCDVTAAGVKALSPALCRRGPSVSTGWDPCLVPTCPFFHSPSYFNHDDRYKQQKLITINHP